MMLCAFCPLMLGMPGSQAEAVPVQGPMAITTVSQGMVSQPTFTPAGDSSFLIAGVSCFQNPHLIVSLSPAAVRL